MAFNGCDSDPSSKLNTFMRNILTSEGGSGKEKEKEEMAEEELVKTKKRNGGEKIYIKKEKLNGFK